MIRVKGNRCKVLLHSAMGYHQFLMLMDYGQCRKGDGHFTNLVTQVGRYCICIIRVFIGTILYRL